MRNLIGKKAIDFTAPAVLKNGFVVENFNFYESIKNKRALLFFYPMDFTFVCPSELIALNNRINEFNSRNVEVVTVSIDSHYVHKAWQKTPITFGGVGEDIKYSMVSDIKRNIMLSYGLDNVSGVAYRGTFIIDDKKNIRIQHIHDFPIGRNIDEYIRLFDALDFHSKHGYVCQAGWVKGKKGIIPSSKGIGQFLTSESEKL